ncbi:MAG: hypothetical protein FWH05_03560 [Oscillospiraceae bacterium]|nr:hypothetical protein [Oscillospiraceae bacterium]
MSKSKKLRFLSGIMAAVFLMSSLLFGSVSADDTIGLSDNIEIGDEGNDDIISEELDEETDETNEETDENIDEINEETNENENIDESNKERNEESETLPEELDLQLTDVFAPGGDKRLEGSTYVPYMPNAHVIEANFNDLVGRPASVNQYGDISFADGLINWKCPGEGTGSSPTNSYHVRYNNLPYNQLIEAGQAGGTDVGMSEPTPDMYGEIDGVVIKAAMDARGAPVVNATQNGRYFTVNVPAGATGARLSVWVHGSGDDRVISVRRGTDPINGQLVGAGQYVPFQFFPGWVSNMGVVNRGSAENRPLKIDFDLPGSGMYTYSNANTGRIFFMRLEYTFDERPVLTDASSNLRIIPASVNLVGKEIQVAWNGNINWAGVDKVSLTLVDTFTGLPVETPSSAIDIQKTWEARVGENKILSHPIPRSGTYRLTLLGSRETGRGAGMLDPGIVSIDNYNDGFAIESPPYPGINDPGYSAMVQLEDPVILTTYRDKFKQNDYIIKWFAVPEATRYELQMRQPIASATNWANARTLYDGPANDFVLDLMSGIEVGGQPIVIGNEYDFRVLAFRNEGPSHDPVIDRVEGTRIRVALDFKDRIWQYGVIGKGFEGSTLGAQAYRTYGFTYLYESENATVLPGGVGSMGEGLTNTSEDKRGFSYHRDHQYHGTNPGMMPRQTNYMNIPISIDPTKSAAEGGFPGKIYMSAPILTKYTDGHNGWSYFYTEIDPERQNWSLEATFKIADRVEDTSRGGSEPTDTQSAFGIIAIDMESQNDLLAYFNSVAVGMGRHRFIAPNGTNTRVEGAPGLVVKTGWTDPTGATSPDGIYCWGLDTMSFDEFYRSALRNDPVMPGYDLRWISHDRFSVKEMGNEGETYVFKLEKDNFGFHGTFISARVMDGMRTYWQYTNPTGENYGGTPFVGNPLRAYGELVRVDANGNYVFDENGQFILDRNGKYVPDYHVRIQDPDRYFVGLFVTRKMAAEITDIKWQEFDPDSQPKPAPGTNPRPTRYQSISLRVDSSSTTGSPTFNAAFVSNVTGTIEISDSNYRRVAGPLPIEGTKRMEIPLNLDQGVNSLYATVKIDRSQEQNLEEGFEIDPDQDEFELRFSITVRSIADPTYAIYVSPGGTVVAAGTRSDPMALREALDYSRPGQQIIMLGGRYVINSRINIARGNNGGTLMSDPGSHVVLDYSNSTNGCLNLRGDDWHFYGFDIFGGNTLNNPGHRGRPFQVSGDNNRMERIRVYDSADTGLQISGDSTESIEEWPHNNLVISSEAWNCADLERNNADGFAAKLTVGYGNMFKYCISSFNADDGWDMFAQSSDGPIGPTIIDSCVAYANGLPKYDYDENGGSFVGAKIGDGNGFKMGGANMAVPHEVRNSIAMYNYAIGFDANTGSGLKVYNSTAFRNEVGMNLTSNYRMLDAPPEQHDMLKFRAYNNLLIESGGRIRQSVDKTHPLIGNEFYLNGIQNSVVSNGGALIRNSDGTVAYGTYDPNLGGPFSDFYIPEVGEIELLDGSDHLWFDLFNSQNPSNPFKAPSIAPNGTIDMHGFLLPTEFTPMSEPIPTLEALPGFTPDMAWSSEGFPKGADFRNLKPDPGSNIIIKPDRTEGGGGGEGGGGPTFDGRRGGGGGAAPGAVATGTGGAAGNTISTRAAVSAVESAVAAAVAQAQEAGRDTANVNVNVRFANVAVVTGETFAAMAAASNESGGRITLTIDSLTADKSRVDVRVIVDVTKANETLNLSGTTTGAVPRQIKERFDKFFSNVALVIQLGQNGSYGQEATVAARAPGITNGERLNFYSYDRATNKFRPLRVSQYRVDKNGYLHFTTSEGGTIVVTKGAIKKS